MGNIKSQSNVLPTIYGGFAIALWSVGALFFCLLEGVPALQLLSFAHITGGLISIKCQKLPITPIKYLTRIRRGWPFLVLLLINQLGYTYAFRLAPAAQVDLIYYSWPIFLVMGKSFYHERPLTNIQIFGLLLAFSGMFILVSPSLLVDGVQAEFLLGYSIALSSGIGWVVYSLFCCHFPKSRTGYLSMGEDLLIIGIGIALLNCFIGEWVAASLFEVGVLISLSICIYGLAFPLWLKGVSAGHYALLGGIANSIPILSVFWLVLGGVAEMTLEVGLAGFFVTAGCFCLAARKSLRIRFV